MSKNLMRIILMLLVILFASSSACWAENNPEGTHHGTGRGARKPYGAWTMTLYNQFCTGSSWERWGCKGYIFYRLDWDRTRGGAKSACDYSCNVQASKVADCLRGCNNALNQEN